MLALRGPQRRSVLAGTLWPDTTEDRALSSLRAAVMRLRRVGEDLVDAGRSRISLGSRTTTDVTELDRRLEEVERLEGVERLGDDVWLSTSGSLTVLAGPELLPGWYDDWVLDERDALQHRQIRALESLARMALKAGRGGLAGALAERAIALEPLLESTQALLIRAHLMEGNPAAAVQVYRSYCRRLGEELGIRPSSSLTDLIGSTGFVPPTAAARA
ncbi:AfsR/SARP family transcriptional regulator [Intrasporangium chromatireducens]|uniref:AfsR/SARP family transcriptional regulator n=1 Tax=Intrasporangium chromatireducens TaxID=1386088 RepID=UPI0004B495A1|nr:BTAD domain-containing putative transcriptional regulator [Intrasporangium chromatireducens]